MYNREKWISGLARPTKLSSLRICHQEYSKHLVTKAKMPSIFKNLASHNFDTASSGHDFSLHLESCSEIVSLYIFSLESPFSYSDQTGIFPVKSSQGNVYKIQSPFMLFPYPITSLLLSLMPGNQSIHTGVKSYLFKRHILFLQELKEAFCKYENGSTS